ncbi:MAG: BamA/TamA family outer membrane protein [bacterium]|nr:BamA/TamA family outer membrane protein [bacterium]
MKRWITLLTLILLSSVAIPAPLGELLRVEWHGAEKILRSQLQSSFPIAIGETIDSIRIQAGLDTTLHRLASLGYAVIKLDSANWIPKRYGGDLHIYLNDTQPLQIETITFTGDSLPANRIGLRPGDPYDRNTLLEIIDEWFDNRARTGHTFAAVTWDSGVIQKQSTHIGLSLHGALDTGQVVIINGMTIPGGESTKPELWVRESRLKFPFRYNPDRIAKAKKFLIATGRFETMSDPEVVTFGPNTILRFPSRIRNAIRIDAVAGYLPPVGTTPSAVSGKIDLGLYQLFGSLRKLAVHWAKPDRISQEFSLQYTEPWLFSVPLALQVGAESQIRDSLYSELKLSLTLEWQMNDAITLHSGYSSREVNADSAAVIALGFSQITGSSWIGGAAYDGRDDQWNPRTGIHLVGEWEYRNLSLQESNQSSIQLQGLRFQLEQSLPQGRSLSWYFAVRGKEWESPPRTLPVTELFRIGGPGTVRGYREWEYSATRFAGATIEPRWLLTQNSRAYFFIDAGYLEWQQVSTSIERKLVGWGAGMWLAVRSGRIGFDLGWNHGDAPLDGKVSFRILQEF